MIYCLPLIAVFYRWPSHPKWKRVLRIFSRPNGIFCFTFQELTEALYQQFELGQNDRVLGIDADPELINVSLNKNLNSQICFELCDITATVNERIPILDKFLSDHHREAFDVVFCFSVSMWIHLNHGDEGLKKAFENIKKYCKHLFLLEPQVTVLFTLLFSARNDAKDFHFSALEMLHDCCP